MCNKVSYFNIWFILIKFAKTKKFKCKSIHFILFLMNFHMRGKKIIGQLFNFTFFERIFFYKYHNLFGAINAK